MFLPFNKFKFCYSPEDDLSTADTSVDTDDKDDVIKFLGEDEPKEKLDLDEVDKPKKVKKDGAESEETDETENKEVETDETDDTIDNEEDDDELQELVEEVEEPEEEKLELVTPVRRREILKKYPELFKDFPYLEKAYYREQKYTELLPTINDAKEAVEKSGTLDKFATELRSGDISNILGAAKDSSPNGFARIVDNLLPTLANIDERAYHHVLGTVIKNTIIAMVQQGHRSNDETLKSAAQILNQFVFNTQEFQPPQPMAKPEVKDTRVDELAQREQEITRRQFESSRNELNTRVNNILTATIEGNIDPKNSMTDYVKRNAIREVSEKLNELLSKDKRFTVITDRLWEDAFKKGFSRDSLDRVRSAYISKARTLLPAVIKQARNEALRGMGKRVKDDSEQPNKKGPVSMGKPRSERTSGNKKDPGNMSSLEFLMQD